MCVISNRRWKGARCSFLYHNESFFGLSRLDYLEVLKKGWQGDEKKSLQEIQRELSNWKPASDDAIEHYISRLVIE